MIPPVIDPQTLSPGEIDLFQRIRDDPSTRDWTVLHSLEVAHHQDNVAGEIDFLAVIPRKGVLCIEVKAHSEIRCVDGRWLFGHRGEPGKSPFKQASAAMHSIRRRVSEHLPDLAGIPFWTCVIFPFVDFPVVSQEWHRWQLIDARAYRSRPIGELLLSVIDRARDLLMHQSSAVWFHRDVQQPSPKQGETLVQALRPMFEVFESPKSRRDRAEAIMKRYTEDQFDALDQMEANARVIFSGPAGTGKTLLAIEAARRSCLCGRRTLLVCYNELLGHWLEQQVEALKPHIAVGTLHSQMLRVIRPTIQLQHQSAGFWENTLPDLAARALVDQPSYQQQFDEIIVDEAQDLLRDSYLDFLDLSMKEGLRGGRIRLFGDFEKQALYEAANITLDRFKAERCPDAAVYMLRTNCRNTPHVAALVRLLCELDPDYRRVRRSDDANPPRFKYYDNPADQQQLLVEALTELRRDRFGGAEVVVLSPKSEEACAAAGVKLSPWREQLCPIRSARPSQIRYSTIQSFKGLEAPAIVVTDIDNVDGESLRALLYVAITRPVHRLIVLASEKTRSKIVQALALGASTLSQTAG